MAVRVELPKQMVTNGFDACIASLRRSLNSNKNQAIKAIIEEELKQYLHAQATLTEIK